MRIFDRTLAVLERALDVRLARHNLLAGNLANADTPGFRPVDLDFAAAMSRGLAEEPEAAPAPPPSPDVARLGAPRARLVSLELAGPTGPASGGPSPLARPGAPGGLPLVAAAGAAPGLDGNAVDADRALVAVSENALQYGAAARAAGKKLSILRYVASDGAA